MSVQYPQRQFILSVAGNSIMNRSNLWFSGLLLLLLWASPAFAQETSFFPVDELREGMRGIGRTVFHGTDIEEFGVEILGVLRNSSPKQDMVLARLSGGPRALVRPTAPPALAPVPRPQSRF